MEQNGYSYASGRGGVGLNKQKIQIQMNVLSLDIYGKMIWILWGTLGFFLFQQVRWNIDNISKS